MTLFIQNDTGGAGTGTVLPNNAEADLFMISNSDMALGETTQPAPSDLIQVTYATQNNHGACPDRLHELVTTDFTMVPAHPVDIIVLAVDDSFTLVDGTPVSQVGGTAMPPAFMSAGTRLNPTNSVLVLYDVGESLCEKGEASGNYDLPTTGAVTLYHELSHARRIATNSMLSLAASGCAASPEENAAEVDENDMRNQLGVPRRDATDHCAQVCPGGGGGGGGSCCIVASIATGSHSIEVNSLRSFRDGFLRRSEVGHAFFERLHYDYYGFSPQVCTAMGNNAPLVDRIRAYCVRPLTAALQLIRGLLAEGLPARTAGGQLRAEVARPGGLGHAPPEELEGALRMVRAGRVDREEGMPLPDDLSVVDAVAPTEHVRWALLDPVEMYLEATSDCAAGVPDGELGERFAARVEAWAPRLPIDPVWSVLSEYETRAELELLGDCLLRTGAARQRFGSRLVGAAEDSSRTRRVLASAGYPVSEEL